MLKLRDYFPYCSHGNILIMSCNYEIHQHAAGQQSHCKVSGMLDTNARCLLLCVMGLGGEEQAHETKTEQLALAIIKVYTIPCLCDDIINNY